MVPSCGCPSPQISLVRTRRVQTFDLCDASARLPEADLVMASDVLYDAGVDRWGEGNDQIDLEILSYIMMIYYDLFMIYYDDILWSIYDLLNDIYKMYIPIQYSGQ